MSTADALVARLVAHGMGTFGTSIFIGTKSSIPTARHLVVVMTGGIHPHGIHAAPIKYRRPSARVVARAEKYPDAEAWAAQALEALTVSNEFLSGIWFLKIRPIQDPYDIGPEPTRGLAQSAFNILIERAE